MQLPGGAVLELVWIEVGTFHMGTPEPEEPEDEENEPPADQRPAHRVTISRGFWLGKFELTQAQWESVMGTRPWEGQPSIQNNPEHPAVFLSWEEVQQFIGRVNEALGDTLFGLPTEAEWEYACRAGATTKWSYGDSQSLLGNYAWHSRNVWDLGERQPHPVGTKRPNPWGLFDMHGNVWEWVQDRYGAAYYEDSVERDPAGPEQGIDRVLRGGSYASPAEEVQSAYRRSARPGFSSSLYGTRLLRRGPVGTLIEPESWGQVKSPARP